MEKTAVDQVAKNFWISYFKDYGQIWVKDVPRRIKQAIRRELKANTIEGKIAPLAKDIGKDNTLSIEAAFIGKLDDQDAKVLVTATFSGEGKMQDLDITKIN